MYYNTPLSYPIAAAPQYLYTTVQAPSTYPFYPNHPWPYLNHRWPVGALPYTHHPWTAVPQTYNHNWAAVPPNHQVVTRAPEVIYSTPRAVVPSYTTTYPQPQAQTRTRGLLVDTYKAPTWTSNRTHAPSQNPISHSVSPSTSTSVFAPRRAVPVYDTEYIRSLNWPSLGPHRPLAPPRRRGVPPQVPVPVPVSAKGPTGRSLRIAFNLTRRIERKEGVPLSFLLQEDVRTLKRLVARPYERVLSHDRSECGPCTITLRFWVSLTLQYTVVVGARALTWRLRVVADAPVPRAGVQGSRCRLQRPWPRYDASRSRAACRRRVQVVLQGRCVRADTCEWLFVAHSGDLLARVSSTYWAQAGSKSALKTTVLEPRTVSMGHLWLVSLRETEREGVYDVGIQNHGPRASCVW